MTMRLLTQRLMFLLNRLGPVGWLGLVLLGIATVGLLASALPKQSQIHDLALEIDRTVREVQQRRLNPQVVPLTPAQQLADFYKVFPKGSTIPDWLEKLNDIATQHDIELDIGNYAMSKTDAGRLNQFRITLPIQATYPQIRAFISDSLAAMPALALESAAFKRDQVDEDFIDARIVFRLFLEKGP